MTSDDKLLERYCRGNDAGAFAELTRRYAAMVLSTAQRVTGDRHDAEDIAQSCFLELAKRAPAVRKSVAAYLHAAAARRAFNLNRDRNRRRHHEREAAAGREPAPEGVRELSWAELSPEIDAAIEKLPEDQRVPVILCYLRGLTAEQAAQELGVRKATIDSRLKVAVRRLRAALATSTAVVPVGVVVAGLRSSSAMVVPATLKADCGRMALAGLGRPVPRGPFDWLSLPSVRWAAAIIAGLGIALAIYAGTGSRPQKAPSRETVYDRLKVVYGQRLGGTFDQRTAAMRRDKMLYWRGSQPLFFAWALKTEPAWFSESDNRLLCLASPLMTDASRLPSRADVANSAELPFTVELLQGMVAARIRAETRGDPARFESDQKLFAAYRQALISPMASIEPARGLDDAELARFTDDGSTLRHILRGRDGGVAGLMTPVHSRGSVEVAIRESLKRNPAFAQAMGADPVIRAASVMRRVNAAASQGMAAVIILLDVRGTPRLIELQESGPSAAELAGACAPDARSGGQRAAEDSNRLTRGITHVSWCTFDGKSMLARIHVAPAEGSEDEPSVEQWATAVAGTHSHEPRSKDIVGRMTPALLAQLSRRADEYLDMLDADFAEFRQDARAQADQRTVDEQMSRELSAEYRSKKEKRK